MSRFLSHRELRAANRALGGVHRQLLEKEVRLELLEQISLKLLNIAGLDFQINDAGGIEFVRVPVEADDIAARSSDVSGVGMVGDAVAATEQATATGELEASSGATSGRDADPAVVDGAA